ncbi:aspartate kinase, partial [Eubacterium ruminantium]
MKRNDYISWDQYFMGIAMLSAERSKDPNTQVGACIVGPDNRILSVGYNGMPQGCEDDDMPWGRDGAALESKYMFVCHAELNAILNYRGSRNFKDAITGFQGVNKYDDYTTLGRGGSDTTAVALAAALHADKCEIYTDVDGVYTADPRKVKNARKL